MNQTTSAPIVTREQFNAMSQQEQRIAIARDVIAQVENSAVLVEQGVYVGKDALGLGVFRSGEIERTLTTERCEVCAVGAAFVSAVRLGDALDEDSFGEDDLWARGRRLGDKPIRLHLRRFFGVEQLSLIEAAFERDWGFCEVFINDGLGDETRCALCERAVDFGDAVYGHDERLIAIMQNIIDNGGSFIP
jgi:hypothetical protein